MRDFAFMDKREVKSFDAMSVPENRETGWILEVSLRYSEPLHNIHNSLPLASVKRVDFGCRAYRMLSTFFRKLHGLSDDDSLPNLRKVEKLLTTLEENIITLLITEIAVIPLSWHGNNSHPYNSKIHSRSFDANHEVTTASNILLSEEFLQTY